MEIVNDVVETEINTTTPADAVAESVSDEANVPEGQSPAVETDLNAAPVTDPAMPVAPAYTPDFKVKIKGKEHEIPEMYRALIKDPESEKQVKEFVEKALGIDAVKQDRTALKEQFEGFKKEITPFIQVYDQFTQLRDQGNLGAAFKVAGISDEQIFEYAVQRLEMEKNPVLAKTYSAQQEQSLKELELQRKVTMYEQQNQVSAEQQFYNEFEDSLTKHQSLADQVNAKLGTPDVPDFFREEVIAYGLAQQQRGKPITPAQATEAVVNKYKQFFPASPASVPQASAPQSATPASPSRPHTLPNVGNGNASPVKKRVTSIEDIRKAAEEANRAG